jgi:hypothetical protein
MKKCISGCGLILLGILANAQEIPLTTGSWNGDAYGNHRAVVRVEARVDAIRVHIPWRRRDARPEAKSVILIDARTGNRIDNIVALAVNRESGDFVFQPASGPGDYFIYYMPYRLAGSRNYPNAVYLSAEATARPEWLARHGIPAGESAAADALPEARVVGFQAVDEFNSFSPMEVIATAEETRDLVAKFPGVPYLVFPEDRAFSIRMTDDLPLRWIRTGPSGAFRGSAARGEFYAFQLGIFAARADVSGLGVVFDDLRAASGRTIPAAAFRCLATGGIDWNGAPMTKPVAVTKGKVQALWCGVQVPTDVAPGLYESVIRVRAEGQAETAVTLALQVTADVLADGGDDDPARLSRLRWFDSTLAMDDEVVAPFTPLKAEGMTVSCLGRSVELAPSGFPLQIRSFFTPEVTALSTRGRDLLTGPFDLVVDAGGKSVVWDDQGVTFVSRKPGAVAWEAVRRSGPLTTAVGARMEMDGFLEFKVRLSTSSPMDVQEVYLEVPFVPDVARYMMGLGQKGGFRPSEFAWTWDQKKNQDALWIGDVNAGVQVGLRAENYARPLNTNFYLSKPLAMPPSWVNEGRGSVTVRTERRSVVFKASGGSRRLEPGQDLFFNFTLLLTPFKTLDTNAQWATRFLHAFRPLDDVARTGANTINVHHATEINPYINYPFLRPAEMKVYIDEAHRRGFKVKIYNTIRELSNRAPELFALRSLGAEIFSRGPGGGYAWLQEHLGADYIAAWYVPQLKDAAVINSGMSRWHNYYVEGLNWLAKNVGIDGLYIDDVAFDRTTMKRVRKALDRNRPGALIDLHSANQYNPRDGYASSANLYLEHFPYLNRLWFGEYFDYEGSPPDFWLVETSGIPFGLMGEMLQDGGNPWRGMVFGMTNRLPWSGKNPADVWRVWDMFGMADSRMIGYWVPTNPVKTTHPDILATAYLKKDRVLISVASWAKSPVMARLAVDWKALGLDPAKARLIAPEIPGVQFPTTFAPGDQIPFEPGKGWLLILGEWPSFD